MKSNLKQSWKWLTQHCWHQHSNLVEIRFRPKVEELEGRRVPARVLYWWAEHDDAIAHVPGNWATYDGTTYHQLQGDFAVDDEFVFKQTDRALTSATYFANFTKTKLTIESSYTKTITLNADVTMVIRTGASFSGTFTIAGEGNLVIGTAETSATFTIDGGNFTSTNANAILQVHANSSGSMVGAEHTFATRSFSNSGIVTWSGGDFRLTGGAKLSNYGRIDVITSNELTIFDEPGGDEEKVVNAGTINVDLPEKWMNFQAPFYNGILNYNGTLDIANGKVYVRKASHHRGLISVATNSEVWFSAMAATTETHKFYNRIGGAPSRISGSGSVLFANDVYIDVQGNLDLVNVTTKDNAREIKGPGTLTVDLGTYHWFRSNWVGGGTMRVGRSTDTTASASLVIGQYDNPVTQKIGRHLDIYGVVRWERQAHLDLSA